MELYLIVLISSLSSAVLLSICSGYNLYNTIKTNEQNMEILKTIIVDELEIKTRERFPRQN